MAESTCTGCGKKITWIETDTGAKVPLDASAPVYGKTAAGLWMLFPVADRRDRGPAVSHFSTCPKASDFSGSKKKE